MFPGKKNPKVKVCKITDPKHPAFGQCGLFAAVNLKPKEWILDYVGHVQMGDKSSQTSDYVLRFDDGLAIDAEKMGNEARFINDFRGTGKLLLCNC